MPSKHGQSNPPSWNRRKTGEDVAVWIPKEVHDRVTELHERRGEKRAHWTMRDTWIMVAAKASRWWPCRERRAK